MVQQTTEQSNSSHTSDVAANFLMLEYQSLYALHQQASNVGNDRLNFYVTFTAIIGSAVIAAQQFIVREAYTWLIVLGVALTLSLGLITFRKMLQRRTAIVIYRRRLSRIRAWFVEHYPSITPALPYDLNQGIPIDWGKNKLGSTASSVAFINTGLIIFTVAAVGISAFGLNSFWWSVPGALASGAITWWLHLVWKRKWIADREAQDRMHIQMLDEIGVNQVLADSKLTSAAVRPSRIGENAGVAQATHSSRD